MNRRGFLERVIGVGVGAGAAALAPTDAPPPPTLRPQAPPVPTYVCMASTCAYSTDVGFSIMHGSSGESTRA